MSVSARRCVFFEKDDARTVASRLVGQGFGAEVVRERFAGEDDDEDHSWAVLTDAPAVMVELLVEEYDGWLDVEEIDLDKLDHRDVVDLPAAPKRSRRGRPTE